MDYAYNKANWLVETRAPSGATTTYNYDAAGNRTSMVDPLGVTTAITYNALNLPAQTTHSTNPLVDTATNTYDARQNLQTQVTVAGALTITTTATYNGNNYLVALTNASQGAATGLQHSYAVAYSDDNLVRAITPGYAGSNYDVLYDGANRVNCWKNGDWLGPVWWTYYADGNRRYAFSGYHPMRPCSITDDPGTWPVVTREEYFYTGQKVTRREWRPYGDLQTLRAASTYSYDSGGNLTSEVRADYTSGITTTVSYGWVWQGGAPRLTTFTASDGVTTTLDYDSLGRITRRYTALGYSDYTYEDVTDWLLRETWHSSISGNVFDWVRYWYGNGRPLRVEYVSSAPSDLSAAWSYATFYMQYNWHGDAVAYAPPEGGYAGAWGPQGMYDPWGNASFWPPVTLAAWHYYRWNGAWGYLRFDDLGLYYVHGRWYNQDTGMFISPNANGSYIYFDNDPINNPHRLNASLVQTVLPPIVNPSCRQTLPGVHPVVNYICDEMVTNASGQYVRQMQQLNTRCFACAWEGVPLWWTGTAEARNNAYLADVEARATAYALWGWLVRHGGPWDHKSEIRAREKAAGRDPDWQQVGNWDYRFDTWSNIHYGYVGIAAGFSADALLEGAGLEQIGSDILAYRQWPRATPGISGWRRFDDWSDQVGIQIGIDLWNTYRLAVKPEDIVRATQSAPGLARQPARGRQP